jgi:hypothetical protein
VALPTKNAKHVTEARALLTEQFRGKTVIQGLLDAFSRQCQAIEDVFWQIIELRYLNSATGVQLDLLGELVKEGRRGRADTDYRNGIKVKIRVLLSKGRAEDLIAIAKLANAPGTPRYEDLRLLNFSVETYSQVAENYLAQYLSQARAAGTYGTLIASDLPLSSLLAFDDSNTPIAGTETFSDAQSGTGKVAASAYGLPSDLSGVVLLYTDPGTSTGDSLLTESGDTLTDESGGALLLE